MRYLFPLTTTTLLACLAAGPTTEPAPGPATTAPVAAPPTVDQRIDQLLAPPAPPAAPAVRKPAVPVGRAAAPTLRAVREGTTLVDRPGWLGHTADGRTAVFTFTADPADPTAPVYPPMVVLPDLELDAMERQQAALGGGRLPFKVSGLVTECDGRNYLRIDRATGTDDRIAPRSPGRPDDRSSGAGAVVPGAPMVPLTREGTRLVNRTGRLNRSPDAKADVLTFDTDGRALRDPPMIVLPNLKLTAMRGLRKGMFKDVKFRVSGTVTEYGGRNYILLDKVVATQDYDTDF